MCHETHSARFCKLATLAKNYADFFTPADIGKREVLSGRECVDVNFSALPLFCDAIQLENAVSILSTEIIDFIRQRKSTINPAIFVEKTSTTTFVNCWTNHLSQGFRYDTDNNNFIIVSKRCS